jgi:hypothetical protein
MFAKIIKYFLKKSVKNISNNNNRSPKFVNYSNAKTVILLFESDYTEKNPEIRRIIQSLLSDGKKVMAWGYIDKRVITTAILPDFRILHNKNTNLIRKPHASFLTELDDMKFDLLIDLSCREIIPLQYLALYANATCKAGVKNNRLNIFDFMIDLESLTQSDFEQQEEINVSFIYNQIIFYLKSIETRD